jgi:ATP-binding cassette subfamily F protein 3
MKEQAVASQAKTKSAVSMTGEILIENFDLTFGAQQLIQNAELNLARGKRYGLVGRNGAGKSTLLRAMDSRGLSLPTNISVLHVEQEVIGGEKSSLVNLST